MKDSFFVRGKQNFGWDANRTGSRLTGSKQTRSRQAVSSQVSFLLVVPVFCCWLASILYWPSQLFLLVMALFFIGSRYFIWASISLGEGAGSRSRQAGFRQTGSRLTGWRQTGSRQAMASQVSFLLVTPFCLLASVNCFNWLSLFLLVGYGSIL